MDFDLIIVGGGLAGASLAVALRASRLRVALVESRPPVLPTELDSRVYAVSPASQAFLSDLGVWRHLPEDRLSPVRDMAIFGDRRGRLQFSAYDSGMGELAWIVESSVMHRELWESLKRQHNVSLFCPAQCERVSWEPSTAILELSDGRRLTARLIVGADGVNSWVREQAAIGAAFRSYDELGVVANFRAEAAHDGTAFQWFRPDGVLALLPMSEHCVSMVWSAPVSIAERLMAMDEASFCSHVSAAAGERLGRLALITPRAAFPLRFMRVDRLVQHRLALIGDAAHAIHPLSGHGINLGFQDARALAECLDVVPPWSDPGALATLRRYARARAEEPRLLQYATHGLHDLFASSDLLSATLRNAGMNLVHRLPVLKQALVRYATNGHF